jgi:histidinol-phosphate aminotransferase
MFSRREFAAMIAAGLTEAAYAQRAAVPGVAPPDTVWLNGNEFPEGPPKASVEAMAQVIGASNRYHYQEFPAFYSKLAAAHGLTSDQILVGAGSSEVLHAAIEAFASPKAPFITPWPTYEAPPELAHYAGVPVIKTPLNAAYAPDVRRLAAEADKAGGGVIYLCNPNNPTSTVTSRDDVAWLVTNLPKNTYLLVDEAYLDYATSPEAASAMPYVKEVQAGDCHPDLLENLRHGRTPRRIRGCSPGPDRENDALPQQRHQHRDRARGTGCAGIGAATARTAQGHD